jgi:hypothetical protein
MHMGVTGWLGEDPDEAPPMPLTEMMLGRQQNRAGPLETALARSRADDIREAREQAAYAPDPDERAASLVVRGYSPGMLQELAQRLGDTTAELEAENEKIEKGKRRAEHVMRMHANGQIHAWDVPAALGDEGDPGRVAQLERQAESLRKQIAEAQDMIAPPRQRDLDPVEAASRAAHEVFREVTRARWAEVQGGSRPRRERRPFDSVSRGDTEHTGPDCRVCAAARERDAARALEDAVAVYGEITR